MATPSERRRSLVTGGSGFIGQHLVAALLERGDRVRVLDQRPPVDRSPVEFVQGSILDPAALRYAMVDVGTVYHLAAVCHFWIPDEREFDRVNHMGTRMVLEAAMQGRAQRFIHGSTQAIILPQRDRESTLSDDPGADNVDRMYGPYTRSKFLAEQAVRDAANRGLAATIVNPTAPVGPGDHNFTPPTVMLSSFLNRPPLFLVDCVLNLVDVRDVARGFLLAAERGRIGERYIVGGEDVGVRKLFADVARMNGGRTFAVPLPGAVALGFGKAAGWFSTNVSRRRPLATEEAVRLALRSLPLTMHMQKSRSQLGYIPRPIGDALGSAVAWLSAGTGPRRTRWATGLPQTGRPRPG